ncbi:hypothetical protein GGS20DRAFT_571640 [Poronia punctata]|nr:hypothetical protein GGS20DRAFT_571640 [Poronia punctata]
MNNTHINLSRDDGEMTESPIIPKVLVQNYPQTQQQKHHLRKSSASKRSDLDRLKSRVPTKCNSPLVPMPLFSSGKELAAVEETPATTTTTSSSSSSSMTTTKTAAAANPTPISPSPSLFPMPPHSEEGIIQRKSPVDIVSPISLQTPTASGQPARPVSSIYSQVTTSTVVPAATSSSSPRTPTMTRWSSVLPGLPVPEAGDYGGPGAQTSIDAYLEDEATPKPTPLVEEPHQQQPAIQVQIQVPRLRSPSLPQSRSRALSNPVGPFFAANNNNNNIGGGAAGSVSSLPAVVHAGTEQVDWPLQKPSMAHTHTQHYVHRSQGSSYGHHHHHHVANKESVSSTSQFGPDDSYIASPRVSMADSHTPIHAPGEQRSGWWYSDDDDDEEDVERNAYGPVGTREKQMAVETTKLKSKPKTKRRRFSKKAKIIAGICTLVVLVAVGVALGVVLSTK